MTTDVALLITLAISIGATVLIAVRSLETLRDAFRVLETAHTRADETRSELLDRLAARDLDHYKLYALAENGQSEENAVDETSMEEIHRGRPWIPGPLGGQNVPEDFDPEAEGLPQ